MTCVKKMQKAWRDKEISNLVALAAGQLSCFTFGLQECTNAKFFVNLFSELGRLNATAPHQHRFLEGNYQPKTILLAVPLVMLDVIYVKV